MNITFIGFGAMAKAIARGLLAKGEYALSASSPSLTEGVNKDEIKTYSDNKKAIVGAQMIILAVKPMQMASVLTEISPFLSDACLISLGAGLSLNWIEAYCPQIPIIRTMPNIPAEVGLSATPMIANVYTTEQQKQGAESIFRNIGLVTWVQDEDDMDTFTALSGSGPAYVFLFMEAMMAAALRLGLDEKEIKLFLFQTIKGAVRLAEQSALSLSELRASVTSVKGTTAAALTVLEPKLHDLIFEAMKAAKLRSKELGLL